MIPTELLPADTRRALSGIVKQLRDVPRALIGDPAEVVHFLGRTARALERLRDQPVPAAPTSPQATPRTPTLTSALPSSPRAVRAGARGGGVPVRGCSVRPGAGRGSGSAIVPSAGLTYLPTERPASTQDRRRSERPWRPRGGPPSQGGRATGDANLISSSPTTEPRAEPLPPEARNILRRIATEIRQGPASTIERSADVARFLERMAASVEGVAALSRPAPSPRAWRVDGITARPQPRSTVTTAGGREVKVEARRSTRVAGP